MYLVHKRCILPIGWLYTTYHLLPEPEKSIDQPEFWSINWNPKIVRSWQIHKTGVWQRWHSVVRAKKRHHHKSMNNSPTCRSFQSDSTIRELSKKNMSAMKKGPLVVWGLLQGMRSYPVVWGLRIAIKQPVQEISNRTHRTDPSTWVSNSSIATYLGVNLGIWSHSIFVEKPGFHGKYPVPGCFVDHFAHVSKNLLPAVPGMSPSAIVASRDCWKIPWVLRLQGSAVLGRIKSAGTISVELTLPLRECSSETYICPRFWAKGDILHGAFWSGKIVRNVVSCLFYLMPTKDLIAMRVLEQPC